ncbi:MAG TPA: hypothetical protein VGS03_15960 [Candidatus Polarisedimenticolia bacterium]|jgi:hypothetical protein|nr:hypothetical protein [Candidatus Polarisedimenticolia bacterium]
MRGKTLPFFATSKDLIELLRPIEETENFRYVLEGGFDAGQERPAWRRAEDIPDFGIAKFGDQAGEAAWLLIPADTKPNVERFRGGTWEVLDQSTMPASVMLSAGGVFKWNILIAGAVLTISDEEWSKRLYGLIGKAFRKHFEKIKMYWVGKEAAAMLRNGARLTFRAASPPEYDLSED